MRSRMVATNRDAASQMPALSGAGLGQAEAEGREAMIETTAAELTMLFNSALDKGGRQSAKDDVVLLKALRECESWQDFVAASVEMIFNAPSSIEHIILAAFCLGVNAGQAIKYPELMK